MSRLPFLRTALALGTILAVAGCAADSSNGEDTSADEAAFTGTPQDDIGQFFMIEHYGVVASGYADVHAMVKQKNLGALILWNPDNADGTVARQMSLGYAASAKASHHPEMFIAADQEERGTQRFKSRHGFTDLVEGDKLGTIVAREGDADVCDLHARITSTEMASVGLNMTLGTVSDVYTHDSGTPGMFRTRAISADPKIITSCVQAMTKAYGEEGHVVFITKHFPGLGNASGNTDVDASVHTYSNTKDKVESDLSPYRAATASVNGAGTGALFGAMISHALYPILDASNSPATLSEPILTELLRSPSAAQIANGVDKANAKVSVAGMGLEGVTVSDAFWTWGLTKNSTSTQRNRLMERSFLAGMDILMIAKTDFNGAWDYFQNINAGTLPAAEQAALASDAKMTFQAFQEKFKLRIAESAKRIKTSKDKVGPVASFVKTGEAHDASKAYQAQYAKLTQ